jgi:lipopolysaccharide transport system permease protein
MYISAVPFPISEIQKKQPEYAWLLEYNPVAQLIEGFRYMILDTGIFTWFGFFYALIFTLVIFLLGLIVFNRTEKTFIDTV